MTIPFGPATAKIQSNTIRMLGDKEAVSLKVVHPCGEVVEVLVWLTEKAAGIARRSLKIAGFNIDAQDLQDLYEQPEMLAGNEVPIFVEDYNGKLRAQIDLQGAKPDAKRLGTLQAAMRSAKKLDKDTPPDGEDIPF